MPVLDEQFTEIEMRENAHVAALDIGSNSFHLVVARIVAGHVQIVHKLKWRVRLADGLDEKGRLSDEAIQRGLDCLDVMAESLKGFAPDSVRIVATYTLRKAKNSKEFVKAAAKILPYPLEIISGVEEARLIYQGVAHTQHSEGNRLVIDIGGGSTECIIGEQFEPKLLRSLQMGCVSYTQKYFAKGELKKKAFDKAITAAQQALEMIDDKYRRLGWQSCIGTSGTIKTISALVDEISQGASNGVITQADLYQLIDMACQAGNLEQLPFKNLSEDRRPVFAAGLAILTALFQSLHIEKMDFSPAALREGVLYQMEDDLAHRDIRERTAQSLATRYDVDLAQAKRVHTTALDLYKQIKADWHINHKELKNLLAWAALAHEVGLQINSRGIHKHSAYILSNIDMPGFNQEQQQLLATLVRFHKKRIRPEEIPEFAQFQTDSVIKLICLLRLAVLLNIKRQDDILPPIELTGNDQGYALKFPKKWLQEKPVFSADLEREIEQIKVLNLEAHMH